MSAEASRSREPEELTHRLEPWFELWGLDSVAEQIEIEFSSRMTQSLGRCYPNRSLIRLAERLRNEPPAVLDEVLCHEAAHLAAFWLHGPAAKPHGKEWQDLVSLAGYRPGTKLQVDADSPATRAGSVRYLHRCPVCQSSRVARRPMRRWRCTTCLDAGLDGCLEISSRAVPERAET